MHTEFIIKFGFSFTVMYFRMMFSFKLMFGIPRFLFKAVQDDISSKLFQSNCITLYDETVCII